MMSEFLARTHYIFKRRVMRKDKAKKAKISRMLLKVNNRKTSHTTNVQRQKKNLTLKIRLRCSFLLLSLSKRRLSTMIFLEKCLSSCLKASDYLLKEKTKMEMTLICRLRTDGNLPLQIFQRILPSSRPFHAQVSTQSTTYNSLTRHSLLRKVHFIKYQIAIRSRSKSYSKYQTFTLFFFVGRHFCLTTLSF